MELIYVQRVVVLGGGHGLSVLLKGLKMFPVELTAIVAVSDDGSSTGKLRKEFNIPAVGDLRNVVISLSESEPLFEKLFQYRFKGSSDLAGHPVGNLLLAALTDINGNLTDAVASFSEILNLKGRVLPLTEDTVTLVAHTKQGEILEGEEFIRKCGKEIDFVEYKERPNVLDDVITEIINADLIILGLGSLVTSIIPNLICPEVVDAIKNSPGRVLYVCNAMTEHGETDNFTVSDHIKFLNKYLGENVIDAVLANAKHIDVDIQERYKELENSAPVVIDDKEIKKLKVELIKEDLVVIQDQMVRHDPVKTAFTIFSYLLKE
jgi:uncharacterized cofD-like protein